MLIHTKFLLSLFLFRTETDKVIKMQNYSLAATSFPLPKGAL